MDDELDTGANGSASALDRLGVELVHWPRDEVLRRRLARAGIARLLLVEQEADAPTGIGVDEDWVRLPADERELWSRAERLSRLSAALDRELPVLREGRILTHGAGTVVLSRSEAVAIRLLLDSIGTVVTRPGARRSPLAARTTEQRSRPRRLDRAAASARRRPPPVHPLGPHQGLLDLHGRAVSRRIIGVVTATVVAIALWFGAATPGVAAANESPSPPALATLIACNGARRPASTSVGGCPAIARGSSSAVHSPTTRRFPVGLSGPAGGLALVAIASVLVMLVALVARRAEVGAAGARAPPVSTS